MPIITLAETKQFLNIATATTTYDSIITALIPTVEDRLLEICNNGFTVQPISPIRYGSNLTDEYILRQVDASFATSGTVTAKGSNFGSANFAGGQDVLVRGSFLNDGYYVVDSVSTSTLTIASTSSFVAEVTGATIYFAVVSWPGGIKPYVANLIQYDYAERPSRTGVSSKRLGPWAETYNTAVPAGSYPKELLAPFDEYKRPGYGNDVL